MTRAGVQCSEDRALGRSHRCPLAVVAISKTVSTARLRTWSRVRHAWALSATLARIKATPRQPGVTEIRIPSERAFAARAANRRSGIEIDAEVYEHLERLGTGHGDA
jgi:LDH2 family malate/lactate/ureidoglycolate dehydrogenase